jgi:hypothetical protein
MSKKYQMINAASQTELINKFIKLRKIAVVGSFRDESKIAYSIVRHLLAAKKYEVFPVNPAKKEVDGLKVYPGVTDLPEGIELVDLVTPPEASLQIVDQCARKGIANIWLQPGACDEKVIAACREKGISCVHDACIMARCELLTRETAFCKTVSD